MTYREPDSINYALALGMVLMIGVAMPRRLRKPSDLVVWLLYVMATIPSIMVPQFADIISRSDAIILAIVITACFLLVVLLAPRGPRFVVPRIIVPTSLIFLLIATLSVASYGYLLYTTGLSFKFVSLGAVRDLRFEYRDQIETNGATLGYVVRLQGNVLNPLILAAGVYKRRWVLIVICALGQLLIFSATGYKITLLSSAALLLLALLFRGNLRPRGRTILTGILASSMVALVYDGLTSTFLYTEVFIDRLLIAGGALVAEYFNVFDNQPKALWGYSFMAPFVDYPYSTTPDKIVGLAFTGDSRTVGNTNFFGDGFANLGYPGILVEALALVLILWLINSSARHLPLAVSALIVFVPTMALVNSSVFTSLFSNGFAAAILLMAALPGNGWGKKRAVSTSFQRVTVS